MPINWNLNASSLTNIARHNFRELGKLMNKTHSFTLAAIGIQSIALGDFNQRFDLLHIPNIGGYKFPEKETHHCKNVIIGLSGIDEVIYGKDILVWKGSWKVVEPLIKKELNNWKNHIHKVNHVHVVSNSELNEMHDYLKIPYEKMKVIPHGVDHNFFKPTKNKDDTRTKILEELNIPNQKYFLHVGEYNYVRKNQKRLGQAFDNARKKGLKFNLVVVGKHYPDIEKYFKKIPGVYMLDWITNEQLLQLYQAAEGFVLPSIHEGFGMPLVEAMACGIPCISSNQHSPPEIVGDAGIPVNPYHVDEISKALLTLHNNVELRDGLSQKSIDRAQLFSWEKNASEILNLYDVDSKVPMENFEESYDLAAYRTLVTVCDFFPDKQQNFIMSLLKFDYTTLIKWALDYGLDNPETKDFLKPFEEWFSKKLKN